jgi:hypothetical protein
VLLHCVAAAFQARRVAALERGLLCFDGRLLLRRLLLLGPRCSPFPSASGHSSGDSADGRSLACIIVSDLADESPTGRAARRTAQTFAAGLCGCRSGRRRSCLSRIKTALLLRCRPWPAARATVPSLDKSPPAPAHSSIPTAPRLSQHPNAPTLILGIPSGCSVLKCTENFLSFCAKTPRKRGACRSCTLQPRKAAPKALHASFAQQTTLPSRRF